MKLSNAGFGYKEAIVRSGEFELSKGKAYPLLGLNGAGKSTFLKTLIGEISLRHGTVEIEGKSLKKLGQKELAKSIAFVASNNPSIPYLKVKDYIALGRIPHLGGLGRLTDEDYQVIYKSFEYFQLEKLRDNYFSELSDGQRQLCAIARAFVQDTPIVILDEPTSFLDFLNKQKMLIRLKEIAVNFNKIVIFSSHDIEAIQKSFTEVLYIEQAAKQLNLGDLSKDANRILIYTFGEFF